MDDEREGVKDTPAPTCADDDRIPQALADQDAPAAAVKDTPAACHELGGTNYWQLDPSVGPDAKDRRKRTFCRIIQLIFVNLLRIE